MKVPVALGLCLAALSTAHSSLGVSSLRPLNNNQ